MTTSPYANPDYCPDIDDLTTAYLYELPRGPAWGEGGAARQPGGVIYGYFRALASMFAAFHADICKLYLEWNCATASETYDWWLAEYSLPDPCDPFPNLCAKVAAFGGCACNYYQALAADLGWAIACGTNCALEVGVIEAGMTPGPVYDPTTLIVVVSLAASPAYVASSQVYGPVAGVLAAGMSPGCGPDISALDCVLQRIVHAEVELVYVMD